jgi:hypothetical protein
VYIPTSTPTKIVLGRGEVYFDRFAPGTLVGEGERYIGNSTEVSFTRQIEKVETWRSERGIKFKGRALPIREGIAGTFTTDNIDTDNVLAWFGDTSATLVTANAIVEAVEETLIVTRNRHYQLGKSKSPAGVRYTRDVKFFVDDVEVDLSAHVEVYEDKGRVHFLQSFPYAANTEVVVQFNQRQANSYLVASQIREFEGALRFVADNIAGENRDYYLPYVVLRADGALSLKGDEWQSMEFQFEAKQMNSAMPQIYILGTGEPGYDSDEEALYLEGIGLVDFPFYEDMLDITVNVRMPAGIGQA